MNENILRLKDALRRAESELAAAGRTVTGIQTEIKAIQDNCKHDWKESYDPIVTEGYRVEGDPPGTMGVDWRGPMWVPREEKPRWKRYCPLCDKTVFTTSTTEEVKKVPRW
jgi:hypothetical protein